MTRLSISFSRYAARFGAGGLLVVSLVIGGLLSVPTSCACGADVAHEHSLFSLPGHWHSELGLDPSTEMIQEHYEGPTVGFGGTAIGVGMTADLAADVAHARLDGSRLTIPRDAAPAAGRGDTPESPPPRG